MSYLVLASERAVDGGAQRALGALAPAVRDLGWHVSALVGEDGPLVEVLRGHDIETVVSADADALGDLPVDLVLSMGAATHAWAGAAAERHHEEVDAAWWLELTLRGRPAEAAALATPALLAAAPTAVAAQALHLRDPELPVEVIAPGTDWGDVAQHHRAGPEARASLGLTPDDDLLVMVSRLDPMKGQDTAIDALASLVDGGRDVHLALVGGAIIGHEGDLADRLRHQADDRGVGARVHHLGFVDDPGPWHAAGSIAIQASAHEAFGLSIVEALAHGTPVIASATDGPSEILDDGRYGVLTAPGDADALARAIADLLEDDGRRSRLAAAGPGRAEVFTPQAAAQRWSDVLPPAYPTHCWPT